VDNKGSVIFIGAIWLRGCAGAWCCEDIVIRDPSQKLGAFTGSEARVSWANPEARKYNRSLASILRQGRSEVGRTFHPKDELSSSSQAPIDLRNKFTPTSRNVKSHDPTATCSIEIAIMVLKWCRFQGGLPSGHRILGHDAGSTTNSLAQATANALIMTNLEIDARRCGR
jgi:hypothetical protein